MKTKRRLIIWLLVVFMLLIGGVICLKEYYEFKRLHPTHKDFEDHLIKGSTVEQIEELYGKFDECYYWDDERDSYVYLSPQERGEKDVVIRSAYYYLRHDLDMDNPVLPIYAIKFNEEGVAIMVYKGSKKIEDSTIS